MDLISGKRTRSKTPSTTIESTPVQGTPPPKTKAKITVPRAIDEVKIIDGPLKLGDVADLAGLAMTKVQNCEVNVCELKEYMDGASASSPFTIAPARPNLCPFHATAYTNYL